MARTTQETKDKFIEYLDKHRDDIKYARKGYLNKLLTGFQSETGCTLTLSQMKRLLSIYRMMYNCPIHYVSDYHYTPAKRAGYHIYVPKDQDQPKPSTEESAKSSDEK